MSTENGKEVGQIFDNVPRSLKEKEPLLRESQDIETENQSVDITGEIIGLNETALTSNPSTKIQ